MRLGERATGLALIVAGALILVGLRWFLELQPPIPAPRPPPGVPPSAVINPAACLSPFIGLGALGLVLVGLKLLLFPGR